MPKTMLTRLALVAATLGLFSSPANATGGFLCKTAGAEKIELSVGIGHVPGGPLIGHQLKRGERKLDTQAEQWWFNDAEMRILLTDAKTLDRVAIMETRRQKNRWETFDGTITIGGQRHWIRCYES